MRDVLAMKKPGEVLPAALAPAFSGREARRVSRAAREGRVWSAFDKNLLFEEGPGTERWRELDVRGTDVEGYLQWWATGDFNEDGVEDLIVFRSMGPTGGSAVDRAAFVLTRTRPEGVLEVLERLE